MGKSVVPLSGKDKRDPHAPLYGSERNAICIDRSLNWTPIGIRREHRENVATKATLYFVFLFAEEVRQKFEAIARLTYRSSLCRLLSGRFRIAFFSILLTSVALSTTFPP